MQKKPLQFKISSALKNIIGSDLISDDFIAVFELVKNSYDAHATKVEITFENIYSENAKIIIKDNGKGMNYDDLINKWLFVAYSAKKEGTEEDSYDYRDKIKIKRAYAGAKGIGRFSCDRLGGELYLETVKDEENSKVETLLTEWDKFEGNLKEEFVNISVLHETIPKSNYNLEHGTVLEISNLKSDWDKGKFLELKNSLAKLINPNNQFEEDEFSIELIVPEEFENDKNEKEYHHKVNGKIENLIFETIDLKTTKIISSVSSKKKNEIQTSLYEAGQLVYEIIEENPFKDLFNVHLELFYLNQSAKATFSRRMKMQPVQYGHLLVYKNGIRVYPYGERGEDQFKFDNRKAQGYNRFIGTREQIGFISIFDTEDETNDQLRETSSRGDGLMRTPTYIQLEEWLLVTLRRLEKFVVDIVNWGNDLSEDEFISLPELKKKEELRKLIESLTKSKGLVSFNLSQDIINIIDEKSSKTVKSNLSKIIKNVKEGNFNPGELATDIKKELKRLEQLENITKEAQESEFEVTKENVKISGELEIEKKKGAFQGALIGTDKERIVSLQHQVYHSSGRIHRNIKLLIRHLGIENIDTKSQKHIAVISRETTKINSIAKFITKANFSLTASEIEVDLVNFIEDYINEVYLFEDKIIDTKMSISINKNGLELEKIFRPLEITTLVDIFISNSEKAKATEINFSFKVLKKKLYLFVSDNGKGISENHLESIFDLGFTTTSGSGIGLFQAKEIVNSDLGGEIIVEKTSKEGITFRIALQ
ncbi:sensor histidine kinase [Brumimicrobium aurantiacum]|uniref:histidine kinase n=1 Tax=Brumimicrobium aurantiacum TaxID=1737063 RepID=A0A3E1F1W5_9FLAO|nr:sensor histidine kinase [Brumimicrobium aurantiacum]RFC55822.1 ATP-binding protein [Brumimicrobium aurantiacum]